MPRQTREEKEMDRRIEETFYKYGHGVQIDIMDIPKIFAIGRRAILEQQDLDEAIQKAIAQFRRN